MSKRLIKHKSFLELLLTTNKVQAKALMDTLTQEQLEALVEIFLNLMKLKVPTKTESLLRKRRRVLAKLIQKRLSITTKLRIIKQHFRQIYDTLLSVKGKLLQLLR